MKSIQVSRRQFLKTTGISVSGLILGCHIGPAAKSSVGNFRPNAFIVISKDKGVILYIPVAEVGQNTRTALAMVLSDELGADLESVSIRQAPPRNDIGWQSASGSRGIELSWDDVRSGAAVAREMLIAGVAQQWKVNPAQCHTASSRVMGPGKRSMAFTEAIAFASTQPVPDNPPLKKGSQYSYVGKPVKVLDAREIGMGKTIFGMDAMPSGVRFAVMVRCPVYQGKIRSFEGSSAKAMPGVVDVLQVGDRVAVVATNTWHAINASKRLSIDWDPGANADASTEKLVIEQKEAVRNPKETVFARGDFEPAFEVAPIRMDREFSAPMLTHASLEPPTCTAWYHDGIVEIWGSCQSLNRLYDALPELTGLPHEKIEYHQLRIGGGFGRKLNHDYIEEALAIAKLVSYPVKLTFTREDDIRHGIYRAPDRYRYQVGMDKNGFPLALQESSARRSRWKAENDMSIFFPNVIRKCTFVHPRVATGPMRGPVQNVTSFTDQSMIDCMAEEVGIDPLEYRLALFGDKIAMHKLGWRSSPVNNPTMCKLLHIVRESSAWKSDSQYGFGVANFQKRDTMVVIVALAPKASSGRPIDKVFAAVYCGRVINPLGARAQVEGGICDGIAAVMYQKVDLRGGRVVQRNYHNYKLLPIGETPEIDIVLLDSEDPPKGLGEMAYMPTMPATANAIYAATGKRTTDLPVNP